MFEWDYRKVFFYIGFDVFEEIDIDMETRSLENIILENSKLL